MGDAVDKVRRREHRAPMAEGVGSLKGGKYAWLTPAPNVTPAQPARSTALRDSPLKTARTWADPGMRSASSSVD